jgi:hypothetical protein
MLVELYDSDVVGVLADLSDLVLEVEVGELRDVAAAEVVDGLSGHPCRHRQQQQQACDRPHTCKIFISS